VFKKILVANRGEIAVRIIRACKELGVRSVAVHSEVDNDAMHVRMADEHLCIGPADPSLSYRNIPNILSAAEITACDAIHPGYGFLAENAGFARACRDAGLTFVGPTPEAIAAMGSKTGSRQLMEKAGVPVVPGMGGAAAGHAELAAFARKAGYPILLKASAGGGGKGMRRVDVEADLPAAFTRVASEAEASFGDGALYAEKLVERPVDFTFEDSILAKIGA